MENQNSIIIRLKSMAGNLTSDLTGLDRQINKNTMSYGKFIKQNKKLNDKFSNLNRDVNRTRKSLGGLNGSFLSLGGTIRGVGIYALSRQLATAIQSNIDMIETINLYNNAMGEFAVQTDKAIQSLSDLTGMDKTNLQNRVGTYNLLARSMGISSDKASILSENINRLGMDLSSLTNTSIQQVAQDLRSGLIGQSRTLYKYGIDVTEAAIAQEALTQGISKSVRNMSQGEKMMLRYSVVIRQAGLSHGDFARTIETPANQLKVLSERFVTLSRALGSVFIPMLQSVLPYINAVVIVLTRLFNSLAKFLGYVSGKKVENINNDNFLGIPDGANKAEKNVGKTGKAIKKLKGQLMGFDEINLWKEPTKPSSGGKGGDDEGGSSPFDMDLPTLENAFTNMTNKAEELADKIQPYLEGILELIKLIGIGFLSWKIAQGILDFLTTPNMFKGLLNGVKQFGNKLALLSSDPLFQISTLIFIIITRFIDLYKKSEKFREGINRIGEIGSMIFGGLGELLLNIKEGFLNMLPDSVREKFETFFGLFSDLVKNLDLDIVDLVLTIGGLALLFTPAGKLGLAVLIFEGLTVAIRALGGVSDETWGKFMDSFKSVLKPIGEFISDTFIVVFEQLGDILGWLMNNIIVPLGNDLIWIWKEIIVPLAGIVLDLLAFNFKILTNVLKSLWDNVLIPLADFFVNTFSMAIDGVIKIVKILWKKVFVPFSNDTDTKYKGSIEGLSDVFMYLWKKVLKPLINYFKDKWAKYFSSIMEGIKETIEDLQLVFEGLIDFIVGVFTLDWELAWSGIKKILKGILGDMYDNIVEWIEDDVKPWFTKEKWIGIMDGVKEGFEITFKNAINIAIKLFNDFIDWVNDKMELKWGSFKIAGKTIIKEGSFQLLNIPNIPMLADGGMVDAGQMFMAREAGPELVGQYGSKTAVMNNDDIVNAVSNGVYSAVASAMQISQSGTGVDSEKEIVINLDGREMGRMLLPKMNNESKRLGYKPILNY